MSSFLFHATLPVALAGIVVEALLGYPAWLYRLIRHPVVWIGWLIDALDRVLNEPGQGSTRRIVTGTAALTILVALPVFCAFAITIIAGDTGFVSGTILCGILASTLMAQRSLYQHVRAVAVALDGGGIAAGRVAVSHIVGRNPDMLDVPGITRAAIESLAENFSDGVVAPLFWSCVAGLPGAVFYKAVNTADSMIGHRTVRYEEFGKASAKLDDFINIPASRLAALWISLAALTHNVAACRAALLTVRRDARRHRSPNAGWPEAAMAGALKIRLAGPRYYGETLIEDHWMGSGRADLGTADLCRALGLYRRACVIQASVLAIACLVLTWI